MYLDILPLKTVFSWYSPTAKLTNKVKTVCHNNNTTVLCASHLASEMLGIVHIHLYHLGHRMSKII